MLSSRQILPVIQGVSLAVFIQETNRIQQSDEEMSNRLPISEVKFALGGHLLLATPKCGEPALQGSVCLVLHHSPEGSMGLVLNKSIDIEVGGLWKFLNAPEEREEQPIRFGGPISGPILALHNQAEWAEAAAGAGVYIAAHLDKLQKLVASHAGEVRIVVGQMQWKSGQLEEELQQGAWLPLPATPDLVFAPEEDMWRRGMREVGNRFVAAISGAQIPPHVSLN